MAFTENGSKLKDAQRYADVINPCLVRQNESRLIIHAITPPPLHLLIVGTNTIMSEIIQLKGQSFE